MKNRGKRIVVALVLIVASSIALVGMINNVAKG
jgi:hypothetical protein